MALVAAAGNLNARDTPPPMVPTPPIPSQTPPVQAGTPGPPSAAVSAQALAANAAALAAAAANQNGFAQVHPGGVNGGVLGSLEYQAAYQAGVHLCPIHKSVGSIARLRC